MELTCRHHDHLVHDSIRLIMIMMDCFVVVFVPVVIYVIVSFVDIVVRLIFDTMVHDGLYRMMMMMKVEILIVISIVYIMTYNRNSIVVVMMMIVLHSWMKFPLCRVDV